MNRLRQSLAVLAENPVSRLLGYHTQLPDYE